MSKDTGGEAFPIAGSEHGYPVPGMTLRDYFAAKAMQGFNANQRYDDYSHEHMAELCYGAADAMIAARAQ